MTAKKIATTGQDGLGRMACALLETVDPEKMLNRALECLVGLKLEGLEKAASIFLFDSLRQELLLAAHKGDRKVLSHCQKRIFFGQCLCGLAAEQRRVVYVQAGHQEARHLGFNKNLAPHGDICVPLTNNEAKLIGVLHARVQPDAGVSQGTLDLMENIGSLIGQALDHSLLYMALQDWNEDLRHSIGEQQKQIDEMHVALAHAQDAKNEFLLSMNHELRTPLNPILGFSQVLLGEYFGTLNDKQKQHVNDILESGKRLLELIDDILELSRVELGNMEMERKKVSIANLLEGALKLVREKAVKHAIGLNVEIAPEARDLEISADEKKLKTVMFNLLSNATKFTPDGGIIRMGARIIPMPGPDGLEAAPDAPQAVEIYVSDTGEGIEKEDQQKVFEDFYQVRRGLSDKTPGTGLGLPLSKRFVEMHGGKIWVQSEGKGKGSRFAFALPLTGG